MTATPKPSAGEHVETDTEARRFADGDYMADYVPASFARKLETERNGLREERDALLEVVKIARNALIKNGHRPGLSGPLVETIDPILQRFGIEP